MKVLDENSLQSGIDEILSKLSTQTKQVQDVQAAIKAITDLSASSFTGMGGQAILSFYENEHLPFLETYQNFLDDYTTTLHQMTKALTDLEPSDKGFIRQTYLENEVESGLTAIKNTTISLTNVGNGHIQSVSDIVSLPRLIDSKVLGGIEDADKNKGETIEN